jgi:hypothetical protein
MTAALEVAAKPRAKAALRTIVRIMNISLLQLAPRHQATIERGKNNI